MLLARSTAVRRPPPLPAVATAHAPVKPRALAISPLAIIRRGAILPSTNARPLSPPGRQHRRVASGGPKIVAISNAPHEDGADAEDLELVEETASDFPTCRRVIDALRVPSAKAEAESGPNRRQARRTRPIALALTTLIFIGYLVLAAMVILRLLYLRGAAIVSTASANVREYWERAAVDGGWR